MLRKPSTKKAVQPAPPRKRGRPTVEFVAVLASVPGVSVPRAQSIRGRLLARLRAAGAAGVHVRELIQEFGPTVRGHLIKLREVGWVQRQSDTVST